MIKSIQFVCCLLIGCVFTQLSAQSVHIDSLVKKFDRYRKQSLQEKIYAHTDRTLYLTGEVMWFSLYYVDGSLHQPLDVSKIAYVEVLDPVNEPVLQTKVKLENGRSNGSLFIPASLSAGNYTLRVYTNWMKNFSPDYYFHQAITIINPFIKPDKESKNNLTAYDAQFFPEGGNLVAGLKSKVGFRVTNKEGKGIDFKGCLIDERNDTLIRFQPLKFGIGNFSFTPDITKTYRIVIKDQKGQRAAFQLPFIKDKGYAMSVQDKGNEVEIEVSRVVGSDAIPVAYLFAHARQMISKAEAKYFQQDKAVFRINKNELHEGVSHFTLFDDKLQPVAERLFFKQPEKKLQLTVQSTLREYEDRAKITLNLQANQYADLSIAVYKKDSLSLLRHENILEYLWLTSDLKGKIESPEFYFGNDPLLAEATDNLMLTHGWRRFNWTDDVLNNNKSSKNYLPEYRSHIINGKITDTNGEPANGITTYLSSPSKIIRVYGSRSNANGDIRYEVKDFIGDQKIVVQTNTRQDSTYRFEITPPFSNQYAEMKLPSFQLESTLEKQLIDRSVAMQLQDIYHREKINHFITPTVDSIPFYGKPDEVYNLDDYTRFPIMEEVMREYVPGVLVRKRKDGFHFMVLDNVNKSVFREDPMILIDGMPVFDAGKIMSFDPLKVKKLEVLDREYYLGALVFPGLVSYSTYSGDLSGFPIDSKSLSLDYEGLQLHREFYSPRYENQDERSARLPDARTLLYWNPSLNTGKDNQQQITFYSSDVTGDYEVVVQGLSKAGAAGSASYSFSVKKLNN